MSVADLSTCSLSCLMKFAGPVIILFTLMVKARSLPSDVGILVLDVGVLVVS